MDSGVKDRGSDR